MITISENVELPIHFFCPLSIQPSGVLLQVVVSPPAVAEPTSGSVSPKAPIFFSCCMAGSHSSFCASDPQIYMEPMANPLCTPKKVAMEGSILPNSAAMIPSIREVPPAQPYPSYTYPHTLSSASLGMISKGKSSCNQ